MSRILIVGIATLDIINSVDGFPQEDAEVRACQQQIRHGGNAANTASVLVQLGHAVDFAGTLADDMAGRFIADKLRGHGIDIHHAPVITDTTSPLSCITLNRENGSRTIVHYRNLPELQFSQFDAIPLDNYDWCHFEGRNCDQVLPMMRKVRAQGMGLSLEVEKERTHIDELIPLADCILFSRPFATGRGFSTADACLRHFAARYPDRQFTCTWGDQGAWGWSQQLVHSPAFIPDPVVDTLGAGDTYNAGLIHALVRRQTLQQAMTLACRLAGAKCGRQGLDITGILHD